MQRVGSGSVLLEASGFAATATAALVATLDVNPEATQAEDVELDDADQLPPGFE